MKLHPKFCLLVTNQYLLCCELFDWKDVVASRTVSTQKGKALAQSQDLYFMETSALTGNQVQQAIQILLQGMNICPYRACSSVLIMIEIHKNKDIYVKMEKSGVTSVAQDPSVKIRRTGRQGEAAERAPENATDSCC